MTRILFLLFVMMFLQSTITFSQQHNIAEIPRINAWVAYKKFMKGDILIVDAMNERTLASRRGALQPRARARRRRPGR